MDKRYFLIIFILIMGFTSLFFISNNSDMIGTASVNVGNFIFSLPGGFILGHSESDSVALYNPDNNLNMNIQLVNGSDTYESQLNWMQNSSSYIILGKGSININNVVVDSIYNKHYYNNNKYTNSSIFYFNMYDNNFKIEITGFDYDKNQNQTIQCLVDVITSLKPNYEMGH